MPVYAQTIVELLRQLRSVGYSNIDLELIRNAYELAMLLFAGCYRPSGKTFIAHAVGTASILASVGVSAQIVAAGLLHAAYRHGDFGNWRKGRTRANRRCMRQLVGTDVEAYVAGYEALRWNSQTMRAIRQRLTTLETVDRDVLVIRLANELEDLLDLGILYCPRGETRREHIKNNQHVLVEIAERLDFPALVTGLTRNSANTLVADLPIVLQSTRRSIGVFRIAPRSCRLRLGLAMSRQLGRHWRRVRRILAIRERDGARVEEPVGQVSCAEGGDT